MHKRRLRNLPISRQSELGIQFPWLKAVDEAEKPPEVKVLSVTVFDHWLSRDEANMLLEGVSPQEQRVRDDKHAKFCALLVAGTPVLSFAFRRRTRDRMVFREFLSSEALSNYCKPNGGKSFGHRMFHVVLPDLGCVFYESWDDTHQFFFTDSSAMSPIHGWAEQSGLFLLPKNDSFGAL